MCVCVLESSLFIPSLAHKDSFRFDARTERFPFRELRRARDHLSRPLPKTKFKVGLGERVRVDRGGQAEI